MSKNADIAVPEIDYTTLTFSQLQELMSTGTVAHIQDIDDVVKVEKETLVGKPFVITGWRYNPEGSLGDFMFVKITTMDNERRSFVDGSTGIKDQLRTYEAKLGKQVPIYVPKGLRVSNYTYHDEISGKDIPATTYYINNES
jgi:hypothetical protein